MKREKNISRRVALNLWLPIIVVVFILVAALGVIEVNPGLGYTILVGDVIYLIAAVLTTPSLVFPQLDYFWNC